MRKKKKAPQRKLSYAERSELVQRERARRPVMRRVMLGVRIVLVLVVAVLLGWMGYTKQFQAAWAYVEDRFFEGTSALGLNLENVFVVGSTHISDDRIIETILPEGLRSKDHYPLFALPIPEMKEKLKTLGWVEDVDIERQLPDTLHIRITERVPVAIWQRGKVFTLVDKHGVSVSEEDVRLYPGLPVMVGADAPEHLEEIYMLLEDAPGMLKDLQSLVRVSGRRWNLLFRRGVELKLPEQGLDKAFATLLLLQKEKQILDRTVKVIDLRDPERVYVLPETPAETPPGKTE